MFFNAYDTLNQAIKAKAVGPLLIKGVWVLLIAGYLKLDKDPDRAPLGARSFDVSRLCWWCC